MQQSHENLVFANKAFAVHTLFKFQEDRSNWLLKKPAVKN
jgi:hypothetical protein